MSAELILAAVVFALAGIGLFLRSAAQAMVRVADHFEATVPHRENEQKHWEVVEKSLADSALNELNISKGVATCAAASLVWFNENGNKPNQARVNH